MNIEEQKAKAARDEAIDLAWATWTKTSNEIVAARDEAIARARAACQEAITQTRKGEPL